MTAEEEMIAMTTLLNAQTELMQKQSAVLAEQAAKIVRLTAYGEDIRLGCAMWERRALEAETRLAEYVESHTSWLKPADDKSVELKPVNSWVN